MSSIIRNCEPRALGRQAMAISFVTYSLLPGSRDQGVQRRPQGDSRDHQPLESGSVSTAALPPCLRPCYLQSTFLFFVSLNQTLFMIKAGKYSCQGLGKSDADGLSSSGKCGVFPTFLTLNCRDVIPSGISSPSLAPNARDLFFHVHLSCACQLSPQMLLLAALPGSACGLEQCLHYWRSMPWQAPRARPVQPEGKHTLGKQVVLPAAKTSAPLAQTVYRGKAPERSKSSFNLVFRSWWTKGLA